VHLPYPIRNTVHIFSVHRPWAILAERAARRTDVASNVQEFDDGGNDITLPICPVDGILGKAPFISQ